MKAVYVQRGETLDFVNETDSLIEAGQVVELGSRVGVAGTDIPVGEKGSVHMTGVFRMSKKAGEAIAAGTDVYYSADGITSAGSTVGEENAGEDGTAEADGTVAAIAGYAVMEADAADTEILVKLLG